jgi:hypothetical protein
MGMSAREFRVIFCEVCRAARSQFEAARPEDLAWEEIERMAAAAEILLRLRDQKRFDLDLAELDRIVRRPGK